jgi:uncharacterized protein DUF4282
MSVDDKGFFASLFDTSFTSLITTWIIKVIYVIVLVLIGLFLLIAVVAAFTRSPGGGVLTLIVATLVGLLYAILTRVWLELVIVIFRIMETNVELVQLTRANAGGSAPPPAGPPPSSAPPPAPPQPAAG